MEKIQELNYPDFTHFFRALADENRLKIIDMLSCGEICACEILCELKITQSTLSHHMKILCECSLTNPRREGKWTFYSLNKDAVKSMKNFINTITSNKENCICKKQKGAVYEQMLRNQ